MKSKPKILVIGDVMLDRYINGTVTRICPEAPVPVLKFETVDERLGGAAAVAMLLSAMDCEVSLVGVIGCDIYGPVIADLCVECGINPRLTTIPATERHFSVTTCKTRFMCGNQQLLRSDVDSGDVPDAVADRLMDAMWEEIAGADCVIISDYGKGVCTDEVVRETIKRCNEIGITSLVDPHGDWFKYSGATLIKPNQSEASIEIGEPIKDALRACGVADSLRMGNCCEHVVLTLGGNGLVLASLDLIETRHIAGHVVPVVDVCGAGDTVIAVLAVGLCNGLSIVQAADNANIAASLQVMRRGVSPITADEIRSAMLHHDIKDAMTKSVPATEAVV